MRAQMNPVKTRSLLMYYHVEYGRNTSEGVGIKGNRKIGARYDPDLRTGRH